MNENDYILASEISEYVFCKHAWELRQKGQLQLSPTSVESEQENEGIFMQLQALKMRTYIAWFFVAIGALIMVSILFFL